MNLLGPFVRSLIAKFLLQTNGCFSGKLVAELKIEPFDLQQLKQFVASPDELDTAKIWDVLQAYKRAFHLVKCAEVSELERNTPYIATILQVQSIRNCHRKM